MLRGKHANSRVVIKYCKTSECDNLQLSFSLLFIGGRSESMASNRNSRTELTAQEIALEIVKAALAGGAIRQAETEPTGDPLKNTAGKAALDAVYAVRFYQNVLARLEKSQEARNGAA